MRDLDIAIGAENDEALITPGAEPVGREPIEPHIAQAVIAAQRHVTEILKARMLGMPLVRNVRLDDLSLR
ncbi:MAG: hypothetical protein WCC26_02500 [Terracidiphilus sp.]